MKQCKKCDELKPVTEFNKRKVAADGLNYWCRSCDNKSTKKYRDNNPEYYVEWHNNNSSYMKEYRKSTKLSYHIVYLLPDHNYVGVTNNPYVRMNNHKQHNRNISNWIELAKFNDRKEALKCEAEYHTKGYEGKKSA